MKRLLAAFSTLCLLLTPFSVSADIDGFTLNGISGTGGLTLDDRFGTGASSSEHLVNYLDCLLYNGETATDTTTETTSGALEGAGEDATGSDESGGDADASFDATDTVDTGSSSDISDDAVDAVSDGDTLEFDDSEFGLDLGAPDTDSGASDATSDTTTSVTLGDSEVVEFDIGLSDPFGEDWKYAVKVGTCDTSQSITAEETDTCFYAVQATDLTTFSSVVFEVDIRHLIGTFDGTEGTAIQCDSLLGTTGERRVYFQIQQGDDTATIYTQEILVQFDYDLPEAPTNVVSDPGESNVKLTWEDEGNSTETDVRYQVYYATETFTDDDLDSVFSTETMSTKETQVEDLDNDTAYFFRVVALDDFDNRSDVSDEVESQPVPVNDFFEQYKEAGGQETGGYCQASDKPASWLAILTLFALIVSSLLVLRRAGRSGRFSGIIILVAGASTMMPIADSYAETPVQWTMNFRVGNYLPEIDSEFDAGTVGPYSQIFDDQSMMLYRAEFGYLLTEVSGRLFFTWQAGYGSVTGSGIEVETGAASSDSTEFHVVPLSFSLFYEFDQIARQYGFPLVPYLRAGLSYNIWWITDGVGDVAQFTDEEGKSYDAKGGTLGGHFTVGMRLLLDVFAKGMAREFDEDLGVNQSYLFIEMTQLSVDDGGSETSFNMSDTLFSFGLGFDM